MPRVEPLEMFPTPPRFRSADPEAVGHPLVLVPGRLTLVRVLDFVRRKTWTVSSVGQRHEMFCRPPFHRCSRVYGASRVCHSADECFVRSTAGIFRYSVVPKPGPRSIGRDGRLHCITIRTCREYGSAWPAGKLRDNFTQTCVELRPADPRDFRPLRARRDMEAPVHNSGQEIRRRRGHRCDGPRTALAKLWL